ncbi:MAG: hypothetical protein AAF533_10835 [Acidobacteriota bacterium]
MPTLDDFRWDGHDWETQVDLPAWRDLFREPRARVVFAPSESEDSPPNQGDLLLVQWLVDHQESLRESLMTGLLAEYPNRQALYDYDGSEKVELMPDVTTAEELRPLLRLNTLYLHSPLADGTPVLGFLFRCAWDEEHGLGIVMNGHRVVAVCDGDRAFSP